MPGKKKSSATTKKKASTAGKKRTQPVRKTAAASKATPLIVTLSGDRPIRHVAKDLKAEGFEVEGMLEAIGSVTGRAHARTLKRLRSIKGVADVSEPHQDIDIGEPGAIS